MHNGRTVIDIHGHLSTPPQVEAFGFNLIIGTPNAFSPLKLPDDLLETAQAAHLWVLDERSIDLQFLSPRPFAMLHWERPLIVEHWTRTTNDLIHQACRLHPDRFRGIAQLPQQTEVDTGNCIAELERCVNELGFVGAIITPDPGGERRTPKLDDEYWFPLYERAEELGCTLIVHGSAPRSDRRIIHGYDLTGDPQMDRQFNFLAEETLATLVLERGTVFERFPSLRMVVVHCGGAPSRFVPGTGRQAARIDVSENLFFDTCAYDPWFLTAALKQRGAARMLFGTEAPGAGSTAVNPETGRPSDDLVPVIDALDFLSAGEKAGIFHDNVKRVFPLLKGI
jgi:predicted TIM-barrel fold metal-dependent hydrolase